MTEDKFLEMIHNWDHDIVPTTLSDMEKNLAHYLDIIGNLPDFRVLLTKDELVIEQNACASFYRGEGFGRNCPPYWKTALRVVNLATDPREGYGRVHHHLPISMYGLSRLVRDAA